MRITSYLITQCDSCKTIFSFSEKDSWLGGYGDQKVICPFCKETVWFDEYKPHIAKKKLIKLLKKYGSVRF